MTELRQRLLAAFRVESREHLEYIRARAEAGDIAAQVDEVFRRAHSLKGAARAVDLGGVESLAHRLESLFARVREGQRAVDAPVLAAVATTLDAVEDALVAADRGEDPEPSPAALAALDAVLGDGPPGTAMPAARESAAPDAADPVPAPADAADTVRVSLASLDRLLDATGWIAAEGWRHRRLAQELRAAADGAVAAQRDWDRRRRDCAALLRRLAADRATAPVARLVDDLGQRLTDLAVGLGRTRAVQRAAAWDLHRLGEGLRDDVRAVRLVAAAEVLEGFRKMVRDLADDEGKRVEFRAIGLEVQADRRVLQALRDPVLHLLRNAVSHGVEAPAQRRARGKPECGQVVLRAAVEGQRLVVTVEDDGAAIDVDAVRQRAVAEGLVDPAAGPLGADDLVGLLSRPGFTTRAEAGRAAGRGMGMSVVAEAVAGLQGEVRLRAPAGGGTAVDLLVPLNLTAQALLLVRSAGQTCALPAAGVERVCRLRQEQVASVEGAPAARLGDEALPLVSLAALLGAATDEVRQTAGVVLAVVLRAAGARLVVAVDGLLAVRASLVRGLDAPGRHAPYLAGTVRLEDGTLAVVLHPAELVRTHRLRAAGPFRAAESAAVAGPPRILVVDDSLTTRSLEKSILEARGYRVLIAEDGLAALDLLHREPVDLVVADIQMPRLDGFGLLRALKAEPALASLPVVLVTSMAQDADRERGLDLGAEAYIVKQRFDQRDLLDAIGQLL